MLIVLKVSFFLLCWVIMWETIPNPGRIKIYTSGCPKNQNKCWNRMGSPPPEGSKKDELEFRSSNNIVIAPAKTGRDKSSSTEVIRTDQANRGVLVIFINFGFILRIVEMKLIAPKIEDTPAKCREKIKRSTGGPEWNSIEDRGGYIVHPVPIPLSLNIDITNISKEGGRSQKLRLFIRGKDMSGADIIIGIIQFPNPPIIIGIIIKKIMTKA